MAAQLTEMDNVKIIFSEPKDGTINGIEYKHININAKYSDDTIGPLMIPLKGCYSFGLKRIKSMEIILCQLLLTMDL